ARLFHMDLYRFQNSLFRNNRPSLRSVPSATHQRRSSQRSETMSATLKTFESPDDANVLREIQAALIGLRFGSVEITVHNAQVVQIERKEKFRLQKPDRVA